MDLPDQSPLFVFDLVYLQKEGVLDANSYPIIPVISATLMFLEIDDVFHLLDYVDSIDCIHCQLLLYILLLSSLFAKTM